MASTYGMSPRYENDLDYDDCGSSDYEEDRYMDANISDEGKEQVFLIYALCRRKKNPK